MQDDAARSIAYVLMVRDISEQKRAEEPLKRINEELQGYAHTVSHDLKGPFTGMLLGIAAVRQLIDDQGVSGGQGERAARRSEGIPAEDLSEIFKPFFKGSGGGTGIGLATVKKIVELYGGSIRACNDDGACFEFALKDYDGGLTGSNE